MKPLEVVIIKDKRTGDYWDGMKWINSTAHEISARD